LIVNYLKNNIFGVFLLFVFTYLSFAYLRFAFSNNVIVILTFLFIIYSILNKEVIFKRDRVIYYLLISIPVVTVVSFFFHTQNQELLLKELLEKLPTLIIPFIVLHVLNRKAQLIKVTGIFIIFSLVAFVFSFYKLISLYQTGMAFNRSIFEKATIIQHLYFGLYQLVALLFLVEFHKNSLRKYVFYFLAIILSIGVFMSTSRISYIIFALLFSMYLFKFLPKHKALVSLAVLLGILVSIVFTIPQLKQKFSHSIDPKSSPRMIIWKNSYLFLKNSEHPWTGVGFDYYKNGSTGTYWLKGLAEKENYKGLEGFNTHNQFFEFILLGGIFGLLFVFLMFYSLYRAIKRKDLFISSLVILLILFSLVENTLDRQWGIVLFSVLMGIIYSSFSHNEKEWLS